MLELKDLDPNQENIKVKLNADTRVEIHFVRSLKFHQFIVRLDLL